MESKLIEIERFMTNHLIIIINKLKQMDDHQIFRKILQKQKICNTYKIGDLKMNH